MYCKKHHAHPAAIIALLLFCLLLPGGQRSATANVIDLVSESFVFCSLPADWQVIDVTGTGCNWQFDSDLADNNTGSVYGCYAAAISDLCGSAGSTVDTVLETAPLDFTGLRDGHISFKYDIQVFATATFQTSVSTDNGSTWQQVWVRTEDDPGPKTAEIDLGSLVDGQADVRIRFRYTAPADDWWWQVDDIAVSANTPFSWNLFLPAIISH